MLEGFNGKTDKVGINICLLVDMEMGTDITVECSHHVKLSETQELSFFKHLKD